MLLEDWEKAGATATKPEVLTPPADIEYFSVDDERVGVRINFNIPGGEHFMFDYKDWLDLLRRQFDADRLSENFDNDVKAKLSKYFDANSWVQFKKLLDENQYRYETVDNWSLYEFSGKGYALEQQKNNNKKDGGEYRHNRPRNFSGKNKRPRRDS